MLTRRPFSRRISHRAFFDAHIVGAVLCSGLLLAGFGVRVGSGWLGLWPLFSIVILVGTSALYVAFNHSFRLWLAILTFFPLLLGVDFVTPASATDVTGGVVPTFILGLIIGTVMIAMWTIASWILMLLLGRCQELRPRKDFSSMTV